MYIFDDVWMLDIDVDEQPVYSTEELCPLSHPLPPVNDGVCFSNSGLTTALREPLAVIVGGNEVDDRTFSSNSTN